MEVYGTPTQCLGDCWAFINMLCDKSIKSREEIKCSQCVANPISRTHGNLIHAEGKMREILSVLDHGEARIGFVDAMATVVTPAVECFKSPYLPTRIKWTGGRSIVHQLVNSQQPANCPRCPPKHHHDAIMAWISGHENKRLGLPMGIEECIRAASGAALFIGMDSGMSHVCHSLGMPVLLYGWPRIDEFHHGKTFHRFDDSDGAIALMERFLG